ncbi:Sigma-54 interaction domain-containing protein [Lampropedia hyalina DSM 16112]|jgi:two-component system C4-dicarboxylate transport response regulator DctD|uniref:Sigma-54 interaction domain-containing protein n=1 Tax=Lampropedia hyalina DSM 16112 TaxID=1122156 RepID=A0A1M5D913_9BURK|nr:response regulator [Lampropedia hyalina]SHF63162.1 Sigma-54 interaction domain-containing protein [Lampropedia hyalina DSM 16112]
MNQSQSQLWLVEDDAIVRRACQQSLALAGFSSRVFESAEAVCAALQEEQPDTVVCDVRLPGMDGMALMQELLHADNQLPVILVTGHGDITMAVQAMRAGAYDFIEKPFTPEQLVEVVRRALEKRHLTHEVRQLKQALARHSGSGIVGNNPQVQQLRRMVATLGPAAVDVLVYGETGAGKEVLAQALHEASGRSGPFVAINCGGLPEGVFESEMFGCEAGAFTGAVKRRIGKIEVPPIDRTPYISQRRSPSCLQNARSIHLSFAVKLLSWPKQVAHMLNLPESLDATPPALAPGFARVKLMKPAIRLQMHR